MALVKKSKISQTPSNVVTAAPLPATRRPDKPSARPAPADAGMDKIAERIGAATEQLASGLAQSAAATKELGRSMEQIARGAEESAGASQEQSSALKRIVARLSTAKTDADSSNRRTEAVNISLAETATHISASVRAIERGAQRQGASVELIVELDRRAKEIGEITRVVSRISDQTNLLALNAAIEAARAGEQGRGFAVVADEVRSLAEVSDKSAREVQSLAETIQKDVIDVGNALKVSAAASAKEAQSAASVIEALAARREDMEQIAAGTLAILTVSIEAERAAIEAQKGAEQVAVAAEEQTAGASEAQVAVDQQAKALDQSQKAAQSLAVLAQNLRLGKARTSEAESISASSEELSASIQELSSASAQIMAAVDQINRASQLQASATQQTAAALNQIEASAKLAQNSGRIADERVRNIDAALKAGRQSVEALVNGVTTGLQETRSSIDTIKRLEVVGRKIEKIIEAIALIAVQTSMLAVSGSVEAARAGDSGRGFAVVSHDIRSLAREASANVERALDTVRGVLDQIAAMKNDLELVAVSAEAEIRRNLTVTASLHKIGGDVAALATSSKSILEGAEGMLSATTEMSQAARLIASAAEETSAAAREAAAATAEQSSGVEDLAAAIEEIASLADELKVRST
jgi:methyl-accepting chemotaxis protein